MKCSKCGTEISEGKLFCDRCGSVINSNQNHGRIGIDNSKKESGFIQISIHKNKIVMGLLICIIIILVSVILYMAFRNNVNNGTEMYSGSESTNDYASEETHEEKSTLTPTYFPKPGETTEILNDDFIRKDLYDSTLVYRRMNEIHNTWLTPDDIYYVIKAVIEDFNRSCENYINNGNDEIFRYLPNGTTAYEQQISYKNKHPNLKQHYLSTEVINTRMGNDYYYAWVCETLQVNENSVNRIDTDHWVYKLSEDNGSWHICDYTRDPVYE